jgi:hypothetical protein
MNADERRFFDSLTLVVELKCVAQLGNEHTAQCLNYLRASDRTLCLPGNFQKPKVEWKRIVHGLREPIEIPRQIEFWFFDLRSSAFIGG